MASLQTLISRFEVFATWVGDTIQLRGFKSGGTTGQVPVKSSGTNFAWAWGTVTAPSDSLKANLASPTFTGTVTFPSTTSVGAVSGTEIGYLDGVTSAIQTQFNLKSPLASPTFTGTPLAPTASLGTNTTQLATTAFVLANGGVVNLTGAVTSVGAATSLGSFTVSQLSGAISDANISGDNTGDNATNSLYSGLAASKADDSVVVKLTGDQTVFGTKTFNTVGVSSLTSLQGSIILDGSISFADLATFSYGAGRAALHRAALNLVTGTDVVAFNGALGTPSGGDASNLTGTATALTVGNATNAYFATNADNATNADSATSAYFATNDFNDFFGTNGYNLGVSINADVIAAAGFVGPLTGSAPAGTLTGTTLANNITASSLVSASGGTTSGQIVVRGTGGNIDGFLFLVSAGANPTQDTQIYFDTTSHALKFGSNGSSRTVLHDGSTISGSLISGGTFGAVNGSAITALNATNISSGTIALTRLVSTQTVGNADATISSTPLTRDVLLTVALTAPRTFTWPLASGYPAGARVSFADIAQTLTSANTATLTRSGADTINGGTSVVLSTAGASPILISDGLSKWNLDVRGVARGGTGATTAAGALTNLGAAGLTANTFSALQNITLSNSQAQTNTITGLGTTTLPGLQVTNTTAATVGAQQYSPSVRWTGQGWKTTATAASQSVDFRAYVVPVQGAANPSAKWVLESSINGAVFSNSFSVLSTGDFTQSGSTVWTVGMGASSDVYSFTDGTSQRLGISKFGQIVMPTASVLGFSSNTAVTVSPDSGFSRKTSTANWIKAGNGTANDASATVEYANAVFGIRTPTIILTDPQNDYNAGAASTYVRLSSDASRTVTGLTFTASQVTGQTHVIVNIGANPIVLAHESASSAAGNRFHNTSGADITLTADQEANCCFDGGTNRWRVSKRN